MSNPLFSVIILNYNGAGFTSACLKSVLASDHPAFEVVLVDNASTDKSLQEAQEACGRDPRVRVIRNQENLFFAGGNNAGIREARGEYLVVLNNDTEVDPGWLREMEFIFQDRIIAAEQPKVRIFGSRPAMIDTAGGQLDCFGYSAGKGYAKEDRGKFSRECDIFYAAGTAMALRKSVLDEVGVFDRSFGMHWEDVDLSWRIHLRGYRVVCAGEAIVYHKGSLSMRKFSRKAKVSWYIRKNRIAGLIKNLSAINLAWTLPGILAIYLATFFKELILDRDPGLAMSSLRAVSWNLANLAELLRARRDVQCRIRLVPDREIYRLMERKPVFWQMLKGAKENA